MLSKFDTELNRRRGTTRLCLLSYESGAIDWRGTVCAIGDNRRKLTQPSSNGNSRFLTLNASPSPESR